MAKDFRFTGGDDTLVLCNLRSLDPSRVKQFSLMVLSPSSFMESLILEDKVEMIKLGLGWLLG